MGFELVEPEVGEGRLTLPERLAMNFTRRSDEAMIEKVRSMAEAKGVTATEVVRQMINHCIGT